MNNTKARTTAGFTLMELLVVIGIIAILAAIVIVAINPSRQFAQARNAQRESNVATILNAIGQNIADNKGTFNCDENGDGDCTDADDCGDISTLGDDTWGDDEEVIGTDDKSLNCLLDTYIPSDLVPYDPTIADLADAEDDTLYTIEVNDVGRYQVCAPEHAEAAIVDSEEYCLTR